MKETISHIVLECRKPAQKQYRCWRHNKVAQVIHRGLCGKLGYDRDEKYYNHEPRPVYESSTEQTAVRLQNTDWQQGWTQQAWHKIKRKCLIIDVACPFDTRFKGKENEEIENYQELKREFKWIWKLRRVTVVPVIIGALGTVSKDIEKWLAEIGVTCRLESLQRACLYRAQPESFTVLVGHLRSRVVTWCLRKTPASHTDALFNEDNYINNTEGARLAKGRLMRG